MDLFSSSFPFLSSLLPELALLLALLLSLAALYLAARVAVYLLFEPMNRVRTVDQVGFNHVSSSSSHRRRLWSNRLRRLRSTGAAPPPYPDGWYALLESRRLKPGDLRQVCALGQNLALFRGESSHRAFVTSAYCPHLGANVAVGGRVVPGEDCVECPFHEWRFRGDTGRCQGVPYSEGKVPEHARLETHATYEANGLIYLWHHSEGEDPNWWPEAMPELNPGGEEEDGWVYQGRNEYEVACHIQDIPENGADVAHLPAVHKAPILVGGEPSSLASSLSSRFSWHEWSVKWSPEEKEEEEEDGDGGESVSHRANVELTHGLRFGIYGKRSVEALSMSVVGLQQGPSLVHLSFQVPGIGFGRGVMLQSVLPIEPMLQRVTHVFYTEKKFWAPFAKLVLYGESILFERDVRVWNSKTYQDRPQLVKEDHLVRKHRRWFSQFYSNGGGRGGGEKEGSSKRVQNGKKNANGTSVADLSW